MKNPQEIHPWDRQEGESAAAYQAFQVYLNLGAGRTVKAAYDARHSKGTPKAPSKAVPGAWKGWSSKHSWVQRASSWDAYQSKQVRDGMAEGLRDDGEQDGRQIVSRYRALLEELCGAAAELIAKARKRLRELEDSGPAEGQMLRAAGEVLGRANRDLLIILGSAALDSGGDDEPGTKATPEPLDLRQAMRPPEAIQ